MLRLNGFCRSAGHVMLSRAATLCLKGQVVVYPLKVPVPDTARSSEAQSP